MEAIKFALAMLIVAPIAVATGIGLALGNFMLVIHSAAAIAGL
jgi:hypothetical protein